MFQLVVVASSAGGLGALAILVEGLPRTFPVPLVIVQHLHPGHDSYIAEILGRRTKLTVKQVAGREALVAGRVYVAPPDRHLLIEAGPAVFLADSQPIHHLRPSADLLFESAARVCSEHIVGVVLSGSGSDGSAGATAIKMVGGIVIAQDEETSMFFGMPQSAIATGSVDYVLPLHAIAGTLIELTSERGSAVHE